VAVKKKKETTILDDKRIIVLVEEMRNRETSAKPKFVLEDFCFPQQVKFIRDTSRYKTAVCSRRAGKSTACAADLVDLALRKPKSNQLYITLTRGNAKRLVWKEVENIIHKFGLKVKANISDLSMTFENGSMIYFAGAATKDEVDKYRGFSFDKVYLDEAQSFRPYIQELIDDVLSYAVLDRGGSIVLIGTPGPIPAGYFFDASHSDGWKSFKWTIFDNIHIKDVEGRLAEERKRRGISETDPVYLREALGLWVQDNDSLVFKYDRNLNHYDTLPQDLVYVFGIDLGHSDADAIAVLGYSKVEKKVYLVEEFIKRKQNITELVDELKLRVQKYKPVRMEIDSGALGKKIADEIIRRHQIPVNAADKHRKLEYIELLNDDLRTGKLMIKRESTCAQDMALVQWDIIEKDRRTISKGFHSDITDAVLYSWRWCNHHFNEPIVVEKKTSEQQVEKFWEDQEKELLKKKNGQNEWWEG
jgi:PBSX family phage terminase large subunit